ncbi:hypothetical protein [Spirosoma sp.]|uniref:hypothetical protein n=1 Tax=Spirosoma sp. TaxID=1899569 RepID=UPI00095A181C|nr:hypothetical protein [Spirosoma sp.]MBN8825663.1 hypothetical protein [Spirosoma sp.]OJW71638.1 MAG: hypothetical protein BGO59_27090 [Spirosoma sp. 48-14]
MVDVHLLPLNRLAYESLLFSLADFICTPWLTRCLSHLSLLETLIPVRGNLWVTGWLQQLVARPLPIGTCRMAVAPIDVWKTSIGYSIA